MVAPPQEGRKEWLMLNLTNAQALADNAIAINGTIIAHLTDADAQRVIDIIRGMQSMSAPVARVSAPTSAPVSAPTTPTVYDHVDADFTDVAWHVDGNVVKYTHKDGKYVFEKAVRNVLNAHLKAHGATYDEALKGWAFMKGSKRDCKGASEYVKSAPTIVTADELNAVYDKWTAKSAKKAQKKA